MQKLRKSAIMSVFHFYSFTLKPLFMRLKNRKIRIAIADDHKIIRDGICSCIERLAKNKLEVVISVGNGKDLIKQLKKIKTDLLFLDLQMPEVSGEDTCWFLKKQFPKLKIVIFTFHRGWDEADGLIRAGARGFLTKDYGYEQIIESIDAVMNGEVYLRNPSINYYEQLPEEKKLLLIKREKRIVKLLSKGLRIADIANELGVSKRTIENHKTHLYKKTNTKNSAELVGYANAMGWVKN